MAGYFGSKKIVDTKLFKNFNGPESGKPRVLFFQANNYASGYYRVGFPAEQIAKRGNIDVDFASKFTDSKDILWRIGKADLIVFQLQQSDLVKWMIDICRKNGIKVVMDMDDDLLDVPEWKDSS